MTAQDLFSPFAAPDASPQARVLRYQNKYTVLLLLGIAPRDMELRQRLGRMIQCALKGGAKIPGRWCGRALELQPPFRERRLNREISHDVNHDGRGAIFILGVLVVVLAIARAIADLLGWLP